MAIYEKAPETPQNTLKATASSDVNWIDEKYKINKSSRIPHPPIEIGKIDRRMQKGKKITSAKLEIPIPIALELAINEAAIKKNDTRFKRK